MTTNSRLSMRSRWRWVAGAVVACVVAAVVAGFALYVFPAYDEVGDADLIYVIGPPTDERLDLAERMLEAGVADEMLVIGYRSGNGDFEVSDMEVCDRPEVTCHIPDPSTTKGEALGLEQYAAEHGTQRTVVITFDPHVARTRYIFDKCYDGEVAVVGVPAELSFDRWVHQWAYQSAAFVKAWATPCA